MSNRSTFQHSNNNTAPRRRIWQRLATTAAALFLASTAHAQVFKKKPTYPEGTVVEISGRVVDDQGEAVSNVIVELTGTRRAFKVRTLRREDENPQTTFAVTDENGNYRLRWTWHRYYNRFSLTASIRYKDHQSEQVAMLAQVDFSDQIRTGSPVTADLVITDPTFLYDFRAFLETVDSDAERKVYAERGKPDKANQFQHPDYLEESWWYFQLGLTYRFHDGELANIESFRPVRPPAPQQ